MNRLLVSSFVVVGSLFTMANPAVAAPTETTRVVSTYASLTSFSSFCTMEVDGSEICTNLTLFAEEGGTGRQIAGSVRVFIYRFLNDGFGTFVSFETGSADGDGTLLTVNRDLTATVKPTAITLRQSGRDVVVSASDSPTETPTSTRQMTTVSDANCTVRTTTISSVAPVVGTITLDGVTYDEFGQTTDATVTELRRCS